MSNFCDFSSDRINIFLILLDASGSMGCESENVKDGVRRFKKSFEDFHGSGSIAVAISSFNNDYYPGEFKKVTELSFDYYVDGCTALCYSIVKAAKQLMDYIKIVADETNTIPRATFILLSDGEPVQDPGNPRDAKAVISKLNYAGVTTGFVAFGGNISKEFGKELGFQAITDSRDFIQFMEQDLSSSVKEQSQSMKSLGEDFFSKATKDESSKEYSQTTAQALNDDSWIDEI